MFLEDYLRFDFNRGFGNFFCLAVSETAPSGAAAVAGVAPGSLLVAVKQVGFNYGRLTPFVPLPPAAGVAAESPAASLALVALLRSRIGACQRPLLLPH